MSSCDGKTDCKIDPTNKNVNLFKVTLFTSVKRSFMLQKCSRLRIINSITYRMILDPDEICPDSVSMKQLYFVMTYIISTYLLKRLFTK